MMFAGRRLHTSQSRPVIMATTFVPLHTSGCPLHNVPFPLRLVETVVRRPLFRAGHLSWSMAVHISTRPRTALKSFLSLLSSPSFLPPPPSPFLLLPPPPLIYPVLPVSPETASFANPARQKTSSASDAITWPASASAQSAKR